MFRMYREKRIQCVMSDEKVVREFFEGFKKSESF